MKEPALSREPPDQHLALQCGPHEPLLPEADAHDPLVVGRAIDNVLDILAR